MTMSATSTEMMEMQYKLFFLKSLGYEIVSVTHMMEHKCSDTFIDDASGQAIPYAKDKVYSYPVATQMAYHKFRRVKNAHGETIVSNDEPDYSGYSFDQLIVHPDNVNNVYEDVCARLQKLLGI